MTSRRTKRRAGHVFAHLVACGALAAGCGSQDVASAHSPARVNTQASGASDGGAADSGVASDGGALSPHDAGVSTPHDAAVAPPPADAAAAEGTDATSAADATAADATVVDAARPAADAASPADAATADEPPTTGGPSTCGFTPCVPGKPCPDLVVDADDLKGSIVITERTFQPTDCAIVEGCITHAGTRRLLRFDTGTANVGTADLEIGAPTSSACFQWSQCHQHYHFKGVGTYTLYESDGSTVAAAGRKQGFCMEDTEPYAAMPGPTPSTPFTCSAQGLHVGWEDIYPNDIDCQWIDITGIPAGSYVLSVVVDSEHLLPESNYANNEARVAVTIPATP
jgi:hypothetical protein